MDNRSMAKVRQLTDIVAAETGLRWAEVEEVLKPHATDSDALCRVIWRILRTYQIESEMLGKDRN